MAGVFTEQTRKIGEKKDAAPGRGASKAYVWTGGKRNGEEVGLCQR